MFIGYLDARSVASWLDNDAVKNALFVSISLYDSDHLRRGKRFAYLTLGTVRIQPEGLDYDIVGHVELKELFGMVESVVPKDLGNFC